MQLERFRHNRWLIFFLLVLAEEAKVFVRLHHLATCTPSGNVLGEVMIIHAGEEVCRGGCFNLQCYVIRLSSHPSWSSLPFLLFQCVLMRVFLIACTTIHAFWNIHAHSTAAQRGIQSIIADRDSQRGAGSSTIAPKLNQRLMRRNRRNMA